MISVRTENIRTESIKNLYQQKGVNMDVLRLDLMHPLISGNKWFKLGGYLEDAKDKKALITFGGAYSNHIAATAEACREIGLPATGIIRGEKPKLLSPTLQNAEQAGMQLVFVSREAYKRKSIPDACKGEDQLVVPEGGYGEKGMRGAAQIISFLQNSYTHILTAVGTGTTLAGLCFSAPETTSCIGIPVLKNENTIRSEIDLLLPKEKKGKYILQHDYHFGGYAKYNESLIAFMNSWYGITRIPTDFVYTGKAFFAADHLIRSGYFPRETRLLVIHTGGLQGNVSLPKGKLIFG